MLASSTVNSSASNSLPQGKFDKTSEMSPSLPSGFAKFSIVIASARNVLLVLFLTFEQGFLWLVVSLVSLVDRSFQASQFNLNQTNLYVCAAKLTYNERVDLALPTMAVQNESSNIL